MPQMSPMSWLLIYLIMLVFLFLIFNFLPQLNKSLVSSQKSGTKSKTIKW